MKQSVLIFLLIFIGFNSSCEKSAYRLCGGDDPIASLPWLKSETHRLNSAGFCNSISRALYKNNTVFILANCDPNVDSMPILYDCDGKQLQLTQEDYQNLNFTGDIELIWKNR